MMNPANMATITKIMKRSLVMSISAGSSLCTLVSTSASMRFLNTAYTMRYATGMHANATGARCREKSMNPRPANETIYAF